MGLDTTFNCWHGPCSSFNSFRAALARIIGIDLMEMQGFGGEQRPWELLKPDPLHVLLNHSDFEGEIHADQCAPLADRLEEVLPLLPEDEFEWAGNRRRTRQFIAGLRAAATAGKPVEFH